MPLNEHDAQRILWIKAIETHDLEGRILPDEVKRTAEGEAGGIVQRTGRLYAALEERQPRLAHLHRWLSWPGWALPVVLVLTLLAGLATDALSSTGRINILAFPLLGLLAWNLGVYFFLLLGLVVPRESLPAFKFPQWLGERWAQFLVGRQQSRIISGHDHAALWPRILQQYADEWFTCQRPLMIERIKLLLHVGTIMLAVGLVGGMYFRGLVFEYKAGWGSTFLGNEGLFSFLSFTMGPASWLTGIEIPGPADLESLRWSNNAKGGDAAPWIHLYAVTADLFIILPRLVLTAVTTQRVFRLRVGLEIKLPGGMAAQPLTTAERPRKVGASRHLSVIPFNFALKSGARERLRLLSQHAYGQAALLEFGEAIDFAWEEEELIALRDGLGQPQAVILAFNLTATPEHEVQGELLDAWLRLLREVEAPPLALLIDETAYHERFRSQPNFPDRVAQRRKTWSNLLQGYGLPTIFLAATPDDQSPDGVKALKQLAVAAART